jgi:pullulanase
MIRGAAVLLLLGSLGLAPGAAAQSVAVAGDLDHLLGCSADWAPDCPQAQMTKRDDGVWALSAALPAGTYAYKAALDRSWDVSYGLHATPGGANIPLTVPAGGATVTFYYDDTTHWITDSVSTPIVVATGDFQSELGCPADWSPDCLRSWLQDPDGDGTSTFTTTALPSGGYQAQDGVAFTVATAGAATTFSFDGETLSVYAGQPRPSLRDSAAHWLTPDTIAWDLGPDPAGHTYQLGAAPDGGLIAGATGFTGGTIVPLTYDPAGLSPALKAKYPHLASLGALHVPAGATRLLRGQVAVAALADGNLVAATGLQIPGVLDSVYATNAPLGPVFHGGRPTLSVWAPTAQTVALERYATSTATAPTLVPMRRDDRTGVWSVTGTPGWTGTYYRYRVTVFAPSELKVVTNSVTDPYSLALSTDSTLSQIVDLGDPRLAPRGWSTTRAPAPIPSARQEIQELHIRDFSAADATVPAPERGSYLAFTDTGSAGMRHLRALATAGVTTVHLLPAFDFAGVPERRSDQAQPPCDLAAYPPDSDQQQACIAKTQATDAYNWGYNPLHYTVPEGSYATAPDGSARTVEFRRMVQALHAAGLRVVLDVVYNHTAAAGQDADSVLDRIVPGYYQRLNATGAVTTDSCCADTAPEHAMMNKLVVDSVSTWARQYKIDGFRFDLMGLDPKQTMLDVRKANPKAFLYGEGWDFGVVGGDARFVQATQRNMAGTGIGTFNDRLRDAVRGGGPFDTDPRIQGFGSGLFTAPNASPANGTPAEQRATLLHSMDLVKLGLAGNLAGYAFIDSGGVRVTGSQVTYNGAPAGYTAAPGEAVTYVDAHDNLILYDALAYKLPSGDRARLQALDLATTALSQGPGFVPAGSDLLRSKSFDDNSYDSGDWFNAIHWDCRTGNGFARGLPPAADNQSDWPYAKPLLVDPALTPTCRDIAATSAQYGQFLSIKRSSPLFALGTAAAVQRRVSFPLSGTAGETPGVITERLDGTGLGTPSVTVVFNATPTAQTQTVAALAGTRQALHPVQARGADPVVRQSAFDPRTGRFTVPADTVAVFVQK